MVYGSHDDIVQIGTPPGPAAVGALRISGANAFRLLAATTRGLGAFAAAPKRSLIRGEFMLPLDTFSGRPGQKTPLPCPARFFLMPGPASYTREDVAEIHLPGSPAILKAALAAIVAAGARAAAPGEFTFRAFANGRISLAQAEAVEAVVRSETDAERHLALSRMGDCGSRRVAEWRERLIGIAAGIEAALDFPDEVPDRDIEDDLSGMLAELDAAGLDISRRGCGISISDEIPHIALVGLANAGKSSLFNAILGADAVIVSPEPSTTRDNLRREMVYDGTRFIVSDNPGYRPEGAGDAGAAVERAFSALGAADMTCWVIDASRRLDPPARSFAAGLSGLVTVVLNKTDLPAHVQPEDAVSMVESTGARVTCVVRASAATDEGVDEIRRAMARAASTLTTPGVWNGRELAELAAAREHCRAAAELGGPERAELAADELRQALAAFSRAMGEGYAEETLERIFSQFCLGK